MACTSLPSRPPPSHWKWSLRTPRPRRSQAGIAVPRMEKLATIIPRPALTLPDVLGDDKQGRAHRPGVTPAAIRGDGAGTRPHLTALAASPQLHPSRRGRRGRHASILLPSEIPFHRVVRLLAQARDPPHFLQLGRRSRLKRVMMPSAVRPRPGMPGRRPFSRSSRSNKNAPRPRRRGR